MKIRIEELIAEQLAAKELGQSYSENFGMGHDTRWSLAIKIYESEEAKNIWKEYIRICLNTSDDILYGKNPPKEYLELKEMVKLIEELDKLYNLKRLI